MNKEQLYFIAFVIIILLGFVFRDFGGFLADLLMWGGTIAMIGILFFPYGFFSKR